MLIRKLTSYLPTFFAFLFTQSVIAAPGDVLSSFSISNISGDGRTPTTPQGITYHDGKLYIVDFGTDRIYRTYPKDVLDTDEITILFTAGESDFNLPLTDSGTDGSTGGGLTFANNFLWNSSPITDQIIKIDPVDGDNLESENTLSTVAFPSPNGITFDGTYFWVVDWQSNTINKVLAEDGSVLSSIPGPSTLPSFDTNSSVTNARPFGITWDGAALWVSDHEEDMIYRINPIDGAILTFFPTPSTSPKGLAWDGEFLWLTDSSSQTIYKIDSGVTPLGIIGCIEKNGQAIDGAVLLSQTSEADQSTTTDANGCFTFSSFVSGVPVSVGISEVGLDEKPIITLAQINNSNDITLTVGNIYAEPGATASDTEDGDISSSIIAVPDVINNPSIIDTSIASPAEGYTVTYNVVDSAGNLADQKERKIYVVDIDIAAPIITLIGDNPMNVEQASVYAEPGATATDVQDGDLSSSIIVSGSVDTNTTGAYTLSYDVSDLTGNPATTVTRTVNIADTTIPVITLVGSASITLEKGDIFTDDGANATDNIDNDISGSISVSGSVIPNTVGSYVLAYNVSDLSGNAATTVTRTINVVDTTLPVIILIDGTPYNQELNTAFTDPGATASDSPNEDLTSAIIVNGSVNTAIAGTYTLTYDVTDAASNAAISVTREVVVADTTPPAITLTGSATINVEQGTSYSDAGATASDIIDGNITVNIIISGDTVDPNVGGTYIIRYDVSDAALNAATQVTRTVIVADTTIPVITLLGLTPTTHEQGTAYTDLGVTAVDNINGDIAASVIVTGAIDVNTASTYTLTYNVFDGSGNAAIPVTRDVIVTDTTPPTITLVDAAIVNHEQGTPYSDAGATAADTIDGDITASIVVTGTVDINTAGSYILSYDVSDAATNTATTVTRTVNISDTTNPTITLQGDATVDSIQGQLFTDPGTTALDNIDGDISANVVTSGTIDINTAGTYVLNYDVADAAANNATTVNRTVNIVSPVIVSIEAETATIGGVHTVSSTNAGFTGSGYIEHSGEGYIEYTFTAFSVPYNLTVRYALDTGDKPLEIILNSASLGNLSFPSTGSFTTWGDTVTLAITPQSGSNTIRLQTTGASGANVDQLTLTPQ